MDLTTLILASTNIVETLLRKMNWAISLGPFTIEGPLVGEKSKTEIDERIAKISVAKTYLQEGLRAIDELESEAAVNKEELNQILNQLSNIRNV